MERYCVVLQDDNGQRAGRMPLIDVLPQMLERLGISVDGLRSLLTQPAPASDVAALTTDRDTWRTACELAAGDVTRIIADRDAWRDIARGMSPASPDVAALDAAKQRAELQLADARQEIEQLRAANAEMYRTMTEASTAAADAGEEVCRVRAELVDARRLQSEYRSEWIAASTRANVALNERDTALNERDAARQDYKLTDTALAAANWQRDLLSRQMADMEQERAELTADRDEWRETAQSSAHKVAVAREALDADGAAEATR